MLLCSLTGLQFGTVTSALPNHGFSLFLVGLSAVNLYSVSSRLWFWSLWALSNVKCISDMLLKCSRDSCLLSSLLLDAVTLCRSPSVTRETGRDVWWGTVCTSCKHLVPWKNSSSENQEMMLLGQLLPLKLIFLLFYLMRNLKSWEAKKKNIQLYHVKDGQL